MTAKQTSRTSMALIRVRERETRAKVKVELECIVLFFLDERTGDSSCFSVVIRPGTLRSLSFCTSIKAKFIRLLIDLKIMMIFQSE